MTGIPRRSALLALLLAAFLHRPASAEPSFDCAAASGALEHLICANPRLSAQDVQLATVYRAARARDTTLLDSQRAWLKTRAPACSLTGREPPAEGLARLRATLCLFNLYEARIHELGARLGTPAANPPSKTQEATAAEAERLTAALMDGLARLEPAFHPAAVSCAPMIRYWQSAVSGHDSSYGAGCLLQSEQRSLTVLMCDDTLVGMFHAAESSSDAPSREEVAHFVAQACPPGG